MAEQAVVPHFSRREVRLVFSGLLLAFLTAALNQTIVATALPTIVGDLGGLRQISWVVIAYLLGSTVSTPLWGKLGDLYGRRPFFLASMLIFLAGSALSGLSQNMLELIVFRAIQGLGGGGLLVIAQAIVGDVVSPRERGRYMGILGAAFGASSVAGPLLGGFLVESLSWRWVFFANLPIGTLALIVTAITLRLPRSHAHHQIDYLGTALLAAGASCLVLLTSLGGTEYPWGSPQIIGLGVAGVVLVIAFIFAERRAAEPVVPLSLFGNRVFTVTSAMGFIIGFALFGTITYLPTFLQAVGGSNPTVSGLELLPMTFSLLLSSIVSGQLISRWGRYKVFPIVGTALMSVGLFLFSRMDANTVVITQSLYMLAVGLGLGMVMQVLVLAVQNAVDYQDLGAATSAATFFRSLGGSFGVALFGAIFNGQLSYNLQRYLPAGGARGVDAGVVQADPAQLQQLPAPVYEDLVQAFAASLDAVFLSAVPFALLAFALSWLLKEVPLRKTVESSGIAESYAMPRQDSSAREIERALTTLESRESRRRIYERIAKRAGVDLAPSETWLLCRIDEHGPATAQELAVSLELSEADLRPRLQALRDSELISGGEEEHAPLAVSSEGRSVLRKVVEARREDLEERLEGWSPQEHEELAHLLERLASDLLRDDPEPAYM